MAWLTRSLISSAEVTSSAMVDGCSGWDWPPAELPSWLSAPAGPLALSPSDLTAMCAESAALRALLPAPGHSLVAEVVRVIALIEKRPVKIGGDDDVIVAMGLVERRM